MRQTAIARQRESKVDVLLVNPPSPDGGIWIRTQHRVGRRSRENMIWPQVSLAQMAALLVPDYSVEIVDAIALRMGWPEFEALLRDRRPRYYLTQVTAPTLTNDMYGVFLAQEPGRGDDGLRHARHADGARDPARLPGPRLRPARRAGDDPARADRYLRGGARPLARAAKTVACSTPKTERARRRSRDHLEDVELKPTPPGSRPGLSLQPVEDAGATATASQSQPAAAACPAAEPKAPMPGDAQLAAIKGLGWRQDGEVTVNCDRPFFRSLDDLPMPLHHLLPLEQYRMPMIKGPYTFIVTSRGCPAGCKYCIKHVSYQYSVRLRSPEKLLEEMQLLYDLGVHHIHMYADLFTVNRDQVVELCRLLIENGPQDHLDLQQPGRLRRRGDAAPDGPRRLHAHLLGHRERQRADPEAAPTRATRWSRRTAPCAGRTRPASRTGATSSSACPARRWRRSSETIAFSKALPLDIALFHVAAPYPGTPFFFEVVENGWFRPGTHWEEVDMDQATVLDYPNLKAEDLLYWQKRAFREWAFRPGPIWTFLKSMNTWEGFKSAVDIGLQTLGWLKG